MKITIIAGARPNFMKIAPLTRAIQQAKRQGKPFEARVVYTGSQNDKNIEPSLFDDLDMPLPDTCLEVESNDFFQRLAGIIVAFAKELDTHPADLVMVVDDLTPTMACTIVARKKGIKVAHLVAGTRSFDLNMPKEVNRMITDGLSDILFTASMTANRNLNQTGTEQANVHFVGNLLMDNLRHNLKRMTRPDEFARLELGERCASATHGSLDTNFIRVWLNEFTALVATHCQQQQSCNAYIFFHNFHTFNCQLSIIATPVFDP
jgi:UDP-N-acetylglucosamine 2-epimerase (non-hydrolysing)